MKKFRGIISLMIVGALMILTHPVYSQFNPTIEGNVVDQIKVSTEVTTNAITYTYNIPEVKHYKKFTFFTGSTNNDSASYEFTLLAGTGGMWVELWKDTITTLHAKSQRISNTDTSGARIFTLDMTDSTALFTDFQWIRRNLASGNGTGPTSNKTWANDFLVAWKP